MVSLWGITKLWFLQLGSWWHVRRPNVLWHKNRRCRLLCTIDLTRIRKQHARLFCDYEQERRYWVCQAQLEIAATVYVMRAWSNLLLQEHVWFSNFVTTNITFQAIINPRCVTHGQNYNASRRRNDVDGVPRLLLTTKNASNPFAETSQRRLELHNDGFLNFN